MMRLLDNFAQIWRFLCGHVASGRGFAAPRTSASGEKTVSQNVEPGPTYVHRSTTDADFLEQLEGWFRAQPDILVLIRWHASAGSKDFTLFSSFAMLSVRLLLLPPQTSVIVFRQPQLPLRGVVTDDFIARCMHCIPDGSEFLVLEETPRIYGNYLQFSDVEGSSHEDLLEALEDARGKPVAVGACPDWFRDSDIVISAIVPDADGVVRCGIY